MSIRFGGTAAQVESAFHTEIHNLTVKGQAHIGNMSDPQIPTSLATVVIGVKALHNFFPKPAHHMGQTVQRDTSSGKWARPAMSTTSNPPRSAARPATTLNPGADLSIPRSQFGITAGCGTSCNYLVEDVGPWDFATIYNVTPLWNAGIDGTGQTIAIAGTSAIDIGETNVTGSNGLNDVTTFRTFFDLPTNHSWNQPIQVSGNNSPLTVCDGVPTLCSLDDLLENSLDVEWSGSVAKNAQIVLVASYPTSTTDDALYDSESYIVDNVGNSSSPVYSVHIMNVSYGECELGLGTAGNVQYYDIWQTAAAEGLAVFVASGDSGSASCDDGGDQTYGTPYAAQYGVNVSGLASTPYNTAVGGTDFNWCSLNTDLFSECSAGSYWSATEQTPPGGTNASYTALGYVPEIPWNDTCANAPLALTGLQAYASYLAANYSADGYTTTYLASGNQKYSITDGETACNWLAYTDYFDGLPTAFEDMVDTVGGSGGASSCVLNTTDPTGTTFGTCTTGQTSTGATNNPDNNTAQASVTITTTDGWPKPSWQQVSTNNIPGLTSDGVRDIPDVSFFASDGFLSSSAYLICVSADTSINGQAYQPCSYSTNVEPFAEEVGGTSVATPAMAGVMALINQKSGAAQGSPNSGLYALAAKQTYSNCKSESGTTGNGCYFNDIDQGTNAMACSYNYDITTASVTPNCTIAHPGDYLGILAGYSATTGYDQATGLGSLNVANVVNHWTASAGLATPSITVTPQSSSINASNSLSVTVSVSGSAGVASGTITLSGAGSSSITQTIGTSPCTSATSCVFTIPAGTFTTSGPVTLTATYNGDAQYTSGSAQAQVTILTAALSTPTITVTPASLTLNSNTSLNVTVSVSGSGAPPTGTVTLSASSGTYTATKETIGTSPCSSAASCAFTIPANSFTGNVTFTAQYSGDGNYAAGQGQSTTPVVITESMFTFTQGTVSPTSVTPGSSATITVTGNAVAGYTGIATLSCAQSSTTATGGDGTTCNASNSGQINFATCGASCSVTFTIGTSPAVAAALDRPKLPGGGNKGPSGRELLGAGSGAILALLVFFGIPARRRSWRSMLSILVALVAIGALASCSSGGSGGGGGGGGGGQNDPGTTAGTYTYTVTTSSSPTVSPAVPPFTFTVTVN
jgi:subtilase family serine protease